MLRALRLNPRPASRDDSVTEVLGHLEVAGRPLTIEEIYLRTGGRVNVFALSSAMQDLIKDGRVRKIATGGEYARYELLPGQGLLRGLVKLGEL